VDLVRKTSVTRGGFFITNYLLFQLIGLVMLFDVWIRYYLLKGGDSPIYREKTHWVQRVWADYLFRTTKYILGVKFHVHSGYEFGDRKIILAARHTSVGDTFMPLVFASIPYQKKLGFVMKKELEWDPAIDFAVSHLDHIFITRGSVDAATEIAQVGMLAKSAELDGVVIFPEGTRFTQKKWNQVRRSMEENGNEELADWMDANPNVLPPRPGGFLALLENNEEADVVFLAHRGFENARTFRDVVNGSFAGSDLHIKYWGIKFEDVPNDESERRTWIMENWEIVNDFTSSD
jgi:1-acyl-sn-glycerol-3-phosphate acyltransferase